MRKVRIRRIHIESLMDNLSELYQRGVDFVDIEGRMVDGEDSLLLSFGIDYMNEEYAEDFEGFDDIATRSSKEQEIKIEKLSDKDIDELM